MLITEQHIVELCDLISENGNMAKSCKQLGLAPRDVTRAFVADSNYVLLKRAAYEMAADRFAEEIVELSDQALNASAERIQGLRLMVDARKWVASKLKPRSWGERVEQVISGTVHIHAVDRPAAETREQWLTRQKRAELPAPRLSVDTEAETEDAVIVG